MKILKKILIAIVAIIAIALITALFVKKEYAIERTISINKPKEAVFNYIKYLKNQDTYSKWAMMDPNMKKTIPAPMEPSVLYLHGKAIINMLAKASRK